ncbi:hypothetical protein CCP3SC5AM1_560015 [Gammaproteobacteria bacterium]
MTHTLRCGSPRQSYSAASVRCFELCDKPFRPTCLHPPLSELRTEEAFVGESCASLQRNPMFWTEADKSGFIQLKLLVLTVV